MARTKPVRLEVKTALTSSVPSDAIKVEPGTRVRDAKRGEGKKRSGDGVPPVLPPARGYELRARMETKGRGGQPVFVLYAFSDKVCGGAGALCQSPRDFAQKLKNTLSCGGTYEDGPDAKVVLQFRDRDRLVKTLEQWGLKIQFSGG